MEKSIGLWLPVILMPSVGFCVEEYMSAIIALTKLLELITAYATHRLESHIIIWWPDGRSPSNHRGFTLQFLRSSSAHIKHKRRDLVHRRHKIPDLHGKTCIKHSQAIITESSQNFEIEKHLRDCDKVEIFSRVIPKSGTRKPGHG